VAAVYIFLNFFNEEIKIMGNGSSGRRKNSGFIPNDKSQTWKQEVFYIREHEKLKYIEGEVAKEKYLTEFNNKINDRTEEREKYYTEIFNTKQKELYKKYYTDKTISEKEYQKQSKALSEWRSNAESKDWSILKKETQIFHKLYFEWISQKIK